MLRTLFNRIILLLSACAAVSAYCPIDGFWVPSAEVDGKIGSFRKGAGITLFAPVCQDCNSLVFWQTNFGNYRKVWTGSIGLGYRRLVTPWAAFGINGFADVSYSEASRAYGQLGFGAELLGQCWEARANGYIPTTRRTCVHQEIIQAQPFVEEGSQRFYSQLTNFRLVERSYKGFDAEAGYSVKLWRGQLWGYGGYYWFADRGVKTIEGPRVRVEYHLFNLFRTCGTRVVLAGEWAYDYLHRNQGLFIASLRVPLCGFKKGCGLDVKACCVPTLCQRMNNRVLREPAIWIDRTREDEYYPAPILGRLTGAIRHLYFVDATGGGTGSLENPFNLEQALAQSGPEDLLFLLGEIEVAGTLQLKHGQTLMGSAEAREIPLDFVEMGIYTVANNGEVLPRARLIGDGTHDVVSLAHHGALRDVDIDANGGARAIVGDRVQNVRLSRGRIGNASGHALELRDALNFTAYDLDFHNIAGDALWISGSNIVMRKFEIDGVAGNGITIRASDGVLVDGLKCHGLKGIAVDAEGSRRVVLRKVGGEGDQRVALHGVRHYALHDCTLHSEGGTLLAITQCSGRGLIRNSELTGTDATLLSLLGDGSHLAFTGENTVRARGGCALQILQSSGSVDGTQLALTFEGEAARAPIQIAGAGEVKVGEVRLLPTGVCSAALSIADANVHFDKLVAQNLAGTALQAKNATLSVREGVLLAQQGPAVDLTGVRGEILLATAASVGSPTQGIVLSDFNGKLTIRDLQIREGAAGSILFDGGKGILSAHGAILNTAGPVLRAQNLRPEGGISLYGLSKEGIPLITGRGGQGVVLENCAGPVLVAGATLDIVDGQAYLATGCTGKLVLAQSQLASSGLTTEVVGLYNATDFTLRNSVIGGGEGELLSGVALYLGADLPKRAGINEQGEATFAPPPIQRIDLRDNAFVGVDHFADAAVDLKVVGAPGVAQAIIERNDTGAAEQAYAFSSRGPEGRLELLFRENKGARPGQQPIQVVISQEGGARAHLYRQPEVMRDNPELIGGRLETTGRIETLDQKPERPKEETEIVRMLGFPTR
ncbi:MAG: inverse autotransporter beta domain-containing protein [Parachlamydiales bacterium]